MKKLILVFAIAGFSALTVKVKAQDTLAAPVDTSWKRGGMIGLNFNQVALSNWAAGGENSISGIALFSYFANYNNGITNWDNSIDLAYGLTQEGKADPRKTDDKLDFASKYGRKAFKHWYYTALLGFRSQFTAGYNYPDDSTVISDFLAPGYVTFGLGMDYKPNSHFSFYMSPVTARLIIVKDQDLADAGSYGVDAAEYDGSGVKVKDGATTRWEFGAMAKIEYNKDVMENITLKAKAEFFSNYIEDPQNVDVNAEVMLIMKVNKYINAKISAQVIYDDNTIIAVDKNDDGIIDESGPRTQFKELFGVGIAYKF
jgi:hypothetical protein